MGMLLRPQRVQMSSSQGPLPSIQSVQRAGSAASSLIAGLVTTVLQGLGWQGAVAPLGESAIAIAALTLVYQALIRVGAGDRASTN